MSSITDMVENRGQTLSGWAWGLRSRARLAHSRMGTFIARKGRVRWHGSGRLECPNHDA